MEISQEKNNDINVINLKGRLDASTAGTLEETLAPLNSQPSIKALVNCQELEYISSAGLRVLLTTAKEFKKNNSKIALTTLNPNVKQVFEISGFTSIFQIYETIEEATAELSA